jgi:hypothetical protein
MLKHMGKYIDITERPDLKNTKDSMMYLPYRVCEECFLLYETTNDIKKYQIDIANIFQVPVNPINFGVDIEKKKTKYEIEKKEEQSKDLNDDDVYSYKCHNGKEYQLFRILLCFNDILWAEDVTFPDKEIYLAFNFLDNWYKIKIHKYYNELDYINVNFSKIFHIICEKYNGFNHYVEKQKFMNIHIGWLDEVQQDKKIKQGKSLNKNIIIEDTNIYDIKELVVFASLELSLQDLKYGTKYENKLNGLLFKEDKPHYVGQLRCVFRISLGMESEKEIIDVKKYNLTKHHNVKFK